MILELKPEFRTDPNNLSLLYIASTSGQLVPMSAVADVSTDIGPLTINHTGQAISVDGGWSASLPVVAAAPGKPKM